MGRKSKKTSYEADVVAQLGQKTLTKPQKEKDNNRQPSKQIITSTVEPMKSLVNPSLHFNKRLQDFISMRVTLQNNGNALEVVSTERPNQQDLFNQSKALISPSMPVNIFQRQTTSRKY